MVITYKLKTIEGVYHKVTILPQSWFFLVFVIVFKKTKGKEEKEIKECVVGVNL
jgi:hypothetical protein